MWLSANVPDAFRSEPVSMVLVDIGTQGGFATIMSAADGATSMYTSTGGGVIGAGEQPGPNAASRHLVRLCAGALRDMKPASAFPPPRAGDWAFNVRTPQGWLRFAAPGTSLEDERHPAHALFAATHEVIGQIRMASGE